MSDKPKPVLDQVNIVVGPGGMPAMTEFYRRLGIEFPSWDPAWDDHHRTGVVDGPVDVDLDSEPFARVWSHGWPAGRTGFTVTFHVADRDEVDRLHDELVSGEAGGRGQMAPWDAFWGARFCMVEDPEGNAVGIMSPVDPSRRYAPPEPPFS